MRLKAREVLQTPRDQVWSLSEGEYELEFEDGNVVKHTKQSIIFNRYCWSLIEAYPSTPITVDCDVVTFLGDGYFDIGTPVKMLEKVFGHICLNNKLFYYDDKEPLLKLVYQTSNTIFNEIVHRVSDAVVTLDAVDFVKVVNDTEIQEAHDRLIPYPESVELSYRAIKSYMNNPAQKNNRFVNAYRAKANNENQANQCIGPRGFVTDLDRTVFKRPIMNGFIRGMGSLYELMAESRTAAKSLNATEGSIRESEYASRRIQLMAMVVGKPTRVDCRSTDYLNMVVTDKYLPNMKGKWYCTEDNPKLRAFEGDETELIGKVVKVRSVFGCKTPNPSQVCTKCLGKLSENIPENSNLGYTYAASLMEKLTQSILSTKHLTHSVKKSAVQLEGAVTKYLVSNDDSELFLRKDIDTSGLYLVLPSNKLSKLTDVLNLDHTNVALNKIGDLEVVGIRKEGKKSTETIDISYRDRFANISRPLLKYIRNVEFEITGRGDYIIPLKDFNKKEPLFDIPLRENDVLRFVRGTSAVLESTAKGEDKLTLLEHFFKLVDMVYDQLSTNFTLLEVLVYASTAFNIAEDNYGLGRNSPDPMHAGRSFIFRNRSASQLLVFQYQKSELLTHAPRIFSPKTKAPHPLDVLFKPQEVIENVK